MSENSFDLKTAYKSIKMIFMVIAAGPIIFLALAFVVVDNPASSSFDLQEPLNLVLIVLTLVAMMAANLVSRKIFEKLDPESDNKQRIETFQRGLIIRLASYEGIELFSIVVFILTGNLLVLLFAAIAFVGIIQNYPSPSRIRSSVGIKEIDLL